MKARLRLIALSLLMVACSGSQRLALPERLQPKELTSLSTIDEALQPEDSVAFYAVRNDNSLIGYLMEPKDDFFSGLVLGFTLREKGAHALRGITLEELREAEQLMVDILNAYVDSAQEVHRCFTPPRFYDHGRQYLFYSDTMGHRCLHVTFYDYGKEALLDTLDTLDQAGIPYVGAGQNLEEASAPVYMEVDGKTVAFVAASRAEMNMSFLFAFILLHYYIIMCLQDFL